MSTKTLYIIIFTIFASTSVAQNRMLKKFPEGYTPEEVGIKVANRFLSGKHMLHGGKWIHYAEVSASSQSSHQSLRYTALHP